MKQNNMKIIICILIFFIAVVADSSNEYLKKEKALEKANDCKCTNGECKPDKSGKLVCTCSGDYYKSGSECIKCDCGKGSAGCVWRGLLISKKNCICKKGYKSVKVGYAGSKCTGDCKQDTCDNFGECKTVGDDIECKCKSGFEGEYCEKKIITTTVKPKTTTTIKKTTPVTSTISTKRKLPSTVITKRPTTRKVATTTKKTSPVPVTTLKTTKRTLPTTTQKKTTVLTTTRKTTPTTKKTSPVPVTTLKTTKSTLPSTTEKQLTVKTTTNATTRSTTQVTTRSFNRTTPMPVTISETKISSTILTKPYTPQMSTTNTTTRTMYSTTAKVSYTALKTSPVTATAPELTTKQSTSTTRANTSPKLTTIRLITNNTMGVTTEKITEKKTSSWPVSTPESTTKIKKSTSQSVPPTTTTRNVTRPIIYTTSTTSSPTKMRSTIPSKSTHLKTEVVTFTKSFTDELSNKTSTGGLVTLTSDYTGTTPGSNETTTELNTTDVNTINDSNETTSELNNTEVFTDGLVTSSSNNITSNGNDTQTTISVTTVPELITTKDGDETLTTIVSIYNCMKIPCKNGGTCVVEKHRTKCLCPYPYGGLRCTDSFWCTEGEGNDLCGSAKCVFNFKTEVGRCACNKEFYFDYHEKSCKPVDLCPLQPDRCKGDHELCLKNECVCEEHFKRNDKNKCIPNFCEIHSDICAQYNATCEENEKDPSNVKCVCRENEVFNGKFCVKANKCDLPSILGCQQICNSTSEQCECNEGFSLNEDGKSCNLTADGPQKCDYNCTPGICVKYNDSEACLCPPTHAYEEGFCQDLCSAQLLPQNLCPGDACEPHPTLGFRCKCEGKFTYNEDNITCRRRLMCSEGDGEKICSNRSAKCIEDFNSEDGFMCICEGPEEMDLDGICKIKCDLKSYQENCWGKRATCEMDGDEDICKCPPLLTMGKNGYCQELAEASYMGLMPFAKKNPKVAANQKVAVILNNNQSVSEKEYSAMKQKLRDSMRLIFGENYKFADIFNCSDFGFYYTCKVEIQFKSDPEGQVNLISDSETCISNGPTTCYIPPALELYSKNLKPDLLSRSDPCSKEIKHTICGGRETVCNTTEDKINYQCTCSEGFSSYSTIYPVTDRRTVIHKCEDINECLIPRACPNRTRCLNTYGSYDCVCQQGYRPLDSNADPKISGCVGFCHGVSCGHGKCKENGFEHQCICDEGYYGEKCKEKVNLSGSSKGVKAALIIMSTIVVPLLLFAIFMVHKYKMLNKKITASSYFDDGSSTITMEPLTPRNLID